MRQGALAPLTSISPAANGAPGASGNRRARRFWAFVLASRRWATARRPWSFPPASDGTREAKTQRPQRISPIGRPYLEVVLRRLLGADRYGNGCCTPCPNPTLQRARLQQAPAPSVRLAVEAPAHPARGTHQVLGPRPAEVEIRPPHLGKGVFSLPRPDGGVKD